ncbi:MAG: GerMN domain-containing protein [Pyrinomonadaceae bacterium]|nr:GerMN domain-containing protein [Pyrinomonadaceae bacterium]
MKVNRRSNELRTITAKIRPSTYRGVKRSCPVIVFVLLTALFVFAVPLKTSAQTEGTRKVTVYFWEMNRDTEGDDLVPFVRYVDAKAPLRPTLEALLAGPTKEEDLEKFTTVRYDDDLKLDKVEIRGRTARIDFTRDVGGDTNPGDLLTLRFEDAVIRTAKQFPNIEKVIVCVNGLNEFGIGMVEDRPKPCPKKW